MSRQFHRSLSYAGRAGKAQEDVVGIKALGYLDDLGAVAVDVVLQVSGISNGDRSWERHWKASIRFMLPETPIQCNGVSAVFVVSE